MATLTRLEATYSGISDLTGLEGATNLTWLNLYENNINDISPLVANTGLGSGDTVDLGGNYLLSINPTSINTHIPILQSRGVTVEFDDETHLNRGEPYTVRLIYFLPSDRQPEPDIDAKMDTLIKTVQQAYADDMESYGFGRKTFQFETDAVGKAVVHHMAGQLTAEYYKQGSNDDAFREIREQFSTSRNIYLVVVDSGYYIGVAGGGIALSSSVSSVYLASHELRHTFGLDHDFRRDPRGFTFKISRCTAEFLDVQPYFNPGRQDTNFPNARIEMLSPPSLVSPPNVIRLRFEVTDPDGLHQAQLLTRAGVIACKRLSGVSSGVEFVTTALPPQAKSVLLRIIDVDGNRSGQSYPIDVTSLLPPPEVVLIPDANLAAVVRDAFGLSPGVALTSHKMLGLLRLYAPNRQITDLTGLEHAHSLVSLGLGGEWVGESYVNSNRISDFSPLEGLTQLRELYLDNSSLSDISALSGLTQLTELYLHNNALSDISALSGLTQLTTLNLQNNSVSDISALSGLTQLTWLNLYGTSISDISVLSGLTQLRSLHLDYTSISDISALSGLTQLTALNLQNTSVSDISALSGLTQLTWLYLYNNSLSDISALSGLTQLTWLFLGNNSLSDISALSGLTQLTGLNLGNNSISDVSPLLGLDLTGFPWTSTGLYLSGNPLSYASINTHIPAMQAKGIEIRFDNQPHPALLKISGDNQKGAAFTPLSQPFVVEVQDAKGAASAGVSVTFAVVTGGGTLSTTNTTTDANGRAQATLTLGPNLGTNTVWVSAAGIESAATFYAISDTEAPPTMADINSDGSINVLDLIFIASALGNTGANLAADVNRDGVVSILDLIWVAGMFEEAAAAPSAQPQVPETLTAVEVQDWLTDARALEVRDPIIKRGFLVLEQLLISLTPKETELLANYPNPFNPETWIPYRLAEDAFVTLTIYDTAGRVVRRLDVGHRIAAVYENRSKAIYWDGRNGLGERVASGVYFYHLSAGDYSATRRMVILK